MDVNRLINFSRKSNQVYHEKIIKEFLEQEKIEYQHNPEDRVFTTKEKGNVSYNADNNVIYLTVSKNKKITYDLENYYVDHSDNRFHKDFVFFLRRRYGLILRTKY